MSKTVYFLGAGATKAVAKQAPMNIDLVKKALEDFPVPPEEKRLIDFMKDIYKRDDFSVNNQIWNLLDYLIQNNNSLDKYSLEKLIDLRRCLLNLVIKELDESLKKCEFEVYDKFIQRLTAKEESFSFISTNYDIILDKAIAKKGLNYGTKVRYPLTSKPIEKYGLLRPERYEGKDITLNTSPYLILKIHGSLNWLYCPNCDEIDITADKGALKTVSSEYVCCNENCTCLYEPLLITPTMYKSYKNRIINDIWQLAENELIVADKIVFIGYALNEDDYQIRCLLMKALLKRTKQYEKVVVIEEETKRENKEIRGIKEKYQELYDAKILDYKAIGFKKYIEEL